MHYLWRKQTAVVGRRKLSASRQISKLMLQWHPSDINKLQIEWPSASLPNMLVCLYLASYISKWNNRSNRLTDDCELEDAIHGPSPSKVNSAAIISPVAWLDRLDAQKRKWIAEIKRSSFLKDVSVQEVLRALQRGRGARVDGVDGTGNVVPVPQHLGWKKKIVK